MTALWSVATVEERRDMVMLILEPGGLHYDVEMKEIAAITPRPVFLPVLSRGCVLQVPQQEEALAGDVTITDLDPLTKRSRLFTRWVDGHRFAFRTRLWIALFT